MRKGPPRADGIAVGQITVDCTRGMVEIQAHYIDTHTGETLGTYRISTLVSERLKEPLQGFIEAVEREAAGRMLAGDPDQGTAGPRGLFEHLEGDQSI